MTYIVSGGALNSTHSLNCHSNSPNLLRPLQKTYQHHVRCHVWTLNKVTVTHTARTWLLWKSEKHFLLYVDARYGERIRRQHNFPQATEATFDWHQFVATRVSLATRTSHIHIASKQLNQQQTDWFPNVFISAKAQIQMLNTSYMKYFVFSLFNKRRWRLVWLLQLNVFVTQVP